MRHDHRILRTLHRRRLAVARNRCMRERQKAGVSIAPAPYTNEVVELLLDAGWLELSVSENREQVGLAMFRLLSDMAKNYKR